MKTNHLNSLDQFQGTLLIPVTETSPQNLLPTEFHGVSVPSRVFFGKKDTHYVVEKYESLHVFVGIGKDSDYKSLRTIFRRLAAKQKELFQKQTALVLPESLSKTQIEAILSGLYWGTYDLGHFKKTDGHPLAAPDFTLQLFSKKDQSMVAQRAFKIAAAQLQTLHLVDSPPNVATPKYLSDWAKSAGAQFGFSVTVLDRKECQKQKIDAFLAVGKGSVNEPQFIIMEYSPDKIIDKTKHIGLVGKGITFDTGGLNIKVAGMYHMKSDMAGGAAVLGAMQLIADLKLPVKVTAIVPACESAVDANSFLPSDVIGSYAGHSIEIIDTDAEGRLILADGLSYLIKNYKPDTIVDLATLTGSAVGTFGYECAALFTNNVQMAQKMQQAGDAIGERSWPLPLWDAYKPDIDSDIADVKNWSGKPVAGAITAAKFLEYFTEGHTAWAHLDIAGVAFGDDEFAKSKHATAFGVQLLTTFIENYTL
ncbi:leucyl aminopeptidase family protein [Flavobacterium caeni]|uniref:Leucyl aminopeptidase n=1 Tax=Flavobacterium caeni TaxID=490189 RepID=A0A1G5D2Z3_9FLAO|nr:leucyl aminopeptidase family protein [Flavobacterium caeni]SCY09004.1 leucyl aminopeptidase [Flavobacterium caeni]